MAWRRFVLEPAAEIAPQMLHPGMGWTIGRLLDHLNTTPWYVAIAGCIGSGKTWLAGRIAELSGARQVLESLDLPRLDAFYHNPTRHAWQIEIEFLDQRTRELAADHPRWRSTDLPVVSDYWFDQSVAFARVWLEPDAWSGYSARWEQSRGGVVRPRLVVLLEAASERLLQRIRDRGRQGELLLTAEQLERISRSLLDEVQRPDQGPVLRLDACEPETALAEALAAIASMK
jgi:deoxyadenosine/deoxycytidine kinase